MKRKTVPNCQSSQLVPAVGYIRMSTDKQEDSPERQRMEINTLASRDGYRIIEWYQDNGKSGTESSKRKDFQRMLVDAKAGRFRAVLVHEHSRFSREDIFEAFSHFRVLRDAEVKLVSTRRGELDFGDTTGIMVAMMEQHSARQESIKIADRVVSGRVAKASRGIRSGRSPFGYDREIYDESGKLICRVASGECFMVPKGWRSKLVPAADVSSVQAVRAVFEGFLKGETLRSLAAMLNSSHHTRSGGVFYIQDVKRMLRNPVYAGVFRFGHDNQGQFAKAETIVIPNNHPAIISPDTFESVQSRLEATSHAPHAKRGSYVFSGLIRCAECGGVIYGSLAKIPGTVYRLYRCQNGRNTGANICGGVYVHVEPFEKAAIEAIASRVISDQHYNEMRSEASRRRNGEVPNYDKEQVLELERKIARGTENLALASGETFADMARLIDGWRRQLEDLRRTLNQAPKPIPKEVLNVFVSKSRMAKLLVTTANRELLAAAIAQVVKEVQVEMGFEVSSTAKHRILTCLVRFQPHLDIAPVTFSIREPYRESGCERVARFIAAQPEPVTIRTIAEELGIAYRSAQYSMATARSKKLVMVHSSAAPGIAKTYVPGPKYG